jgi:soluble lytic murein transglycosylase-like protein
VKVSKLYAANGATAKTTIYPGRSICLPAGATEVSNEAPTTTKAPATTVPPTTAPATTAPARTYQPSEVEAIIRSTWPDELEEKALAITWRESNNKPGARNSCCYGLFQLNYSAHRRWLSDIGVSSATQLLDPQVNATAALTLYHRAGGWGPWGG